MEDKLFKYRGKSFEEIKSLSFDAFAKLLPSNLRRKVKRGFSEQEKIFLNKVRRGDKILKTHSRDMIIIPEFVGKKISIYNGKTFIQILITQEMLGIRFGELAPSKKIGVKHAGSGSEKTPSEVNK